VLLLGAVTALLGIAHAAVQNRLSRVIAYSTVENTGLILTGFGVALAGTAVGNRLLVAIGLLAATLQMIAHTVAKSHYKEASSSEVTPNASSASRGNPHPPSLPLCCGRGELVEAQDRVEADREPRPGQQRGDRGGRLGVRVRQPGVQGRDGICRVDRAQRGRLPPDHRLQPRNGQAAGRSG
jgi:Proton-conducting membrane transporter